MLRKQVIILCAFANDLNRPLQLKVEEKIVAYEFISAENLNFQSLHVKQVRKMAAQSLKATIAISISIKDNTSIKFIKAFCNTLMNGKSLNINLAAKQIYLCETPRKTRRPLRLKNTTSWLKKNYMLF